MTIDRMTVDELAAFASATDTPAHCAHGKWWVEPKRLFFRPLLPFEEISPGPNRYPKRAWLGGVQHVVPNDAPANSQKGYFVFEEPQRYELGILGHGQANRIRKGLRLFRWSRISDQDQFMKEAFPVYSSFYERTRYGFKSERKHPSHFARWAQGLFAHPKVVVSGAYQGDRLSAVSVYYLVDDILMNGTYFSDTASQVLQVHDFVLHKLREDAATTDAKLIYMGPHTGAEGIDRAKEIRGCSLITKRTHLQLNPLAAGALKLFYPRDYSRLWKIAPEKASAVSDGTKKESK